MQLWCATLTPFRTSPSGQSTPDLDRVRAHVRWLVERGVDALAPTGTTGEFLYLRPHERAEIHRATIAAAAELSAELSRELPVMPCVFDPDPGIMVDLARRAQDRGAWGVFTPPPVFQPVHGDDVVDWYERLVQAVRIPVYAYHHPRVHNPLDFPLLERLVDVGVAGLKDSSGDERRVRFLAQVFPQRIIAGGEQLLGRGKRLGPIGGQMCRLANLRPRLCRELLDGSARTLPPLVEARDAALAAIDGAGGLPAMKVALGMGRRPPVVGCDEALAAGLEVDA